MWNYLFQRIVVMLCSLFFIMTTTFFLLYLLPGDPFSSELFLDKTSLQALYHFHGLDLPIYKQYYIYITKLLQGNLGHSLLYADVSVNRLILDSFWVSCRLGLQSIVLAVFFGVLVGVFSVRFHQKAFDHLGVFLSAVGVSIPSFVICAILQYFFCIYFPIFPVAKSGTLAHTILPTIALAIFPSAFIIRITRANLLDICNQGYMQLAFCKGLGKAKTLWTHGLRGAILPVIAYLGPLTSQVLTGSFVVEKIFAIPGMGQWMVLSIQARDYPMITGLTLFISCCLMLCVFISDIILALSDPTIRSRIRVS